MAASKYREVLRLLVKLLIQPGDGVQRLVKGIKKAKDRVEIMIFRFDRVEIERALINAVERGVFVHALIAFTNRGGEQNLRKLEKSFLANGITVARTADDLVRYHGKMMIVDRKELLIYDPKISDRGMLRLLEERKKAGVDVRIIGCASGKRLAACELKRIRLHTRTIIRDRTQAFLGSQSLRQLELDARREIGMIFRDASGIKQAIRIFEEDWAETDTGKAAAKRAGKDAEEQAAKNRESAVSAA